MEYLAPLMENFVALFEKWERAAPDMMKTKACLGWENLPEDFEILFYIYRENG